jgi:hypothetical protein
MIRVRMLTGIAGEGRVPGELLDLPAHEARALIAAQRAELVRGESVETPERAQHSESAAKPATRRTATKKG